MKFFFDNCVSPRLARALHIVLEPDGFEIVCIRDKPGFTARDADEEWLPRLRDDSPDWNVVTADLKIRSNPHRRRAWQQAQLTSFFLEPAWMDLKPLDQLWRFIQRWPEITSAATQCGRGTAHLVPVRGRIRRQPLS